MQLALEVVHVFLQNPCREISFASGCVWTGLILIATPLSWSRFFLFPFRSSLSCYGISLEYPKSGLFGLDFLNLTNVNSVLNLPERIREVQGSEEQQLSSFLRKLSLQSSASLAGGGSAHSWLGGIWGSPVVLVDEMSHSCSKALSPVSKTHSPFSCCFYAFFCLCIEYCLLK